jgi:hypothetical protein
MPIRTPMFYTCATLALSLSLGTAPALHAEGLFLSPSAPTVRSPFPQETATATAPFNSLRIALEALKQGQTRQALVLLESWVEEHPEDLEAFFYLAKASYALGDFPAMRRYLATLNTLAPQDAITQQALAWANPLPEAKPPTVEDEKNTALLNLARSVANSQTPSTPFRSPAPKTPSKPPATLEEKTAPSVPSTEALKTPASPTPLPMVQEGAVDQSTQAQQPPQESVPNKAKTPVSSNQANSPSVGAAASLQASASPAPLTQEQIAQNFQMLQQLMMMQLMNNSSNSFNPNNPMNMMMMNGQGMNGLNMFNGTMLNNTMLNNPNATPAMTPQVMNQLMQNSLLNNMNGMFNTTPDAQNNNGGLGF